MKISLVNPGIKPLTLGLCRRNQAEECSRWIAIVTDGILLRTAALRDDYLNSIFNIEIAVFLINDDHCRNFAMRDAVSSLIQLTSFSWLILSWTLTVVAKRTIPSYHSSLNTFLHGNTHKLPTFRCVSHRTVKNGAERLGAL